MNVSAVAICNKRRVLVFCRPYLVPDFQANIAPLEGEFDFHFITDGRCPGITDTRTRFYARLDKSARPTGFSEEDEADVVERCRYLRNLPRVQALNMLRAMASIFEEEIDQYRPNVVLSHMVDDYVTHLAALLSLRHGLVYVGYAYSYFPGLIQVTQYGNGAPHNLREPSDDEVRQTLDAISQRTFRQNYLQKDTYSRMRHLAAMLRYRAKKIVFAIKALIDKDPLHVHYGCLPYVVERRHWRDFPSPSDFHGDWRARIKTMLDEFGGRRPILYFPLGYFPEATIDYWIEDRRILNYQEVVLNICRELGANFIVVVKEHLHMLGGRDTVFYRKILSIPGVVSVPPLEFSNEVLEMSDVVLMGAGSIGVESFIRGKPIASFCNRSYWFGEARAAYVDLAHMEQWGDRIQACIKTFKPPSDSERFEFVRHCLRSTMRTLKPGRRWPICEPVDLRLALEAGRPLSQSSQQDAL